MTYLKLAVPQTDDLSLLLSLCQRLGIRVIEQEKLSPSTTPSLTEEAQQVIMSGVSPREDFSSFVEKFEASRQDRAR